MSPIFQRPGAQAQAPARPARPATQAPAARPAAPARPAVQSTKPTSIPSYAGATGVRPVGTPLPTNAVQPVPGAPSQNATFAAPARPVNPLMTGMPSVPSMAAPAGGPKLSARAQALKAGGPKGGARERMLNQDLDLFDIIKGHLLDEGYADSEEAALTIMANMSEEWKQSIIESGYFPTKQSQREDEAKYGLGGQMVKPRDVKTQSPKPSPSR